MRLENADVVDATWVAILIFRDFALPAMSARVVAVYHCAVARGPIVLPVLRVATLWLLELHVGTRDIARALNSVVACGTRRELARAALCKQSK